MSETDKEFLDGLIGRPITVSDRVRLFALARRGAEAAARIERLEDEGDKARARADTYRMALEDIAYGDPLHNENDMMRIARAALEEK